MKIAVVTNEYPTEQAPHIGTFVRLNAQAIARHHEVTVIHLRSEAVAGEENHYEDARVQVRAFSNALKTPEDFDKAKHIVYSLAPGFNLIHTMNLRSLIPLGMKNYAEEQLACAWVHSEPWQLKTPADWPDEIMPVEEILLKPDGLTAPAEKMLTQIRQKRYENYTTVVPFIVPAPGSATSTQPDEFGDFANRPRKKGQLKLVSFGSVTAKHQPEIAIRTVKTLRASGIDATLIWMGEGSAKIRSQEKVKELGLDQHIQFLSGQAAGGVHTLLSQADLFIGPTKKENFYLPLAQALLSGLPAVVGEGGTELDYLDPKVTRIVTEKNSKYWAQACQELQADTINLSSSEIAASVGNRFSPETVGAAYDQTYQESLRRAGWEA